MELSKFASRPQRASNAVGQQIPLYSNYFTLAFDSPDIEGVNKYQCKFTPDVPDNAMKVRKDIVSKCREAIKEKLDFFIQYGAHLYSYKKTNDLPAFEGEVEGIKYKLELIWVQVTEKCDKDHQQFLKIFFNTMMRSLKFEQMGRKLFNPLKKHVLEAHKVQVWPGFDARLIMKEDGVLLNIDVCHKVIRSDTALQFLNTLRDTCEKRGLDFKEEAQQAMSGATVVTSYNNKTYRIERVDFENTPETTFDKQGTQTSFASYYQTRYKETITNMGQPLLVNKDRKTGNEICLIPELCKMTGLTDAMRADFRLMKDLAVITHTDASRKVEECKNLFDVFSKNEKCVEKMKNWKLQFKQHPVALEGFKYTAGNMVMGAKSSGERTQFEIEKCTRDIDRKIQDKMFEQPAIQTWGIFYSDRDQQVAKQFLSTMEQCIQQIGYPAKAPAMFPVKGGNNASAWVNELKSKLKPSVQAVVLLLPGQKGKCTLYDDVKRLLIKEIPVPSQVVLCGTISRGKNVRSIVSKILIQICAKVGGIPWTVDNLPFMDQPTMICGMDVFHSVAHGNKSVLAFCASLNNSSTRYFSTTEIQDVGQEMGHTLSECMIKAVKKFETFNGNSKPARIIFYRDGVGEGQAEAVCPNEIEQIKQGLKKAECEAKLMYLNVNKRVNTKIFGAGNNPNSVTNPTPGTVIDKGITDMNRYEFYLISVAAKQGMAGPTRYTVLHDEIGESPDKIELLTYKLCFTYYNVSGAIKVPATIQYAHRLAYLVGERGSKKIEPPKPHNHFEENLASLYFI